MTMMMRSAWGNKWTDKQANKLAILRKLFCVLFCAPFTSLSSYLFSHPPIFACRLLRARWSPPLQQRGVVTINKAIRHHLITVSFVRWLIRCPCLVIIEATNCGLLLIHYWKEPSRVSPCLFTCAMTLVDCFVCSCCVHVSLSTSFAMECWL